MIPQRTLSGECEITTGAFSITKRPPVYTGESAALNVQVSFKFQGVDYVLPSGVVAEMYLRYPNTDLMTVAVEMEKSGNTASGVLSAEQTGVAGYPLLVIQLIDMETSSLIVACATAVKISDVRGDLVIDSRAPSPSEIIYIGRSPYINPTNGHWMQWDVSTNAYVDTEVVARGLPATFTANATTLPEGSDATASIGGTALNPVINVGIPKGDTGAKGNTGSAAGFGTPTASVDSNVGTPSVQVTASGPNTAKVFNFAFHNLKGQKGDTGGVSSVNGKTGPVQLNDEDIPSTIDGKANVEAVLSYHSQQIGDLTQLDVTANNLVEAVNGVNSNFSGVQIVKAGKITTTGDNVPANTLKWFTVNDNVIRNTDIILFSLVLTGGTTDSVLVPRSNIGNGWAEMGFYSTQTYSAGTTIGFNYIIIRN